MICGGDEFGRTQKGNNNAYCQDNEISWINWNLSDEQRQLLEFTKRLIALRAQHPVFRRPKFFQGRRIRNSEIKDAMWFNSGGNEMNEEEWTSPFFRCIGMLLSGDSTDIPDAQGQPIRDETFLLLINAHYEPIDFVLPGLEKLEWELVLDTNEENGFLPRTKLFASGDDVQLMDRSACLLRLSGGAQEQARQESWRRRHVDLPPALTAEEERAARKKTASENKRK
jgi:glycogen operon protein